MGVIQVLSDETINQIAAGEVIEHPASVVKELVDNSLDAGASRVAIEVRGGGFQLIRVSDDGLGMGSEDAKLCFERHATSKITDIEGLSTLQSMGFRGEALSSIAAVSRMRITTSREHEVGSTVEVEGGKVLSISPSSRQRGTTFEVRSLFYNVPARRKFQKQPAATAAEIHKWGTTMALAYPEKEFCLTSNEEVVFDVRCSGKISWEEQLGYRIEDLFQGSFLSSRLPICHTEKGYHLYGFIGTSNDHRPNRVGQYLFVNRRPIYSQEVSFAVKEGYGHRLPPNRFPVFILHMTVPPDLIDVNVHPQKKEIRFQEKEWVRRYVREAVRMGCMGTDSPHEASSSFGWVEKNVDSPFEECDLLFREEPLLSPASLLCKTERVIGLLDHYLLLDGSTVEGFAPGILWIDLLKVQEMLTCAQVREHQISSQELIVPIPVVLPSEEWVTQVEQWGFSLRESGKLRYWVDAIPSYVEEKDVQDVIWKIVASEEPAQLVRFALRKRKFLSLPEAVAIWDQIKTGNWCEAVKWMGIDEIRKIFS